MRQKTHNLTHTHTWSPQFIRVYSLGQCIIILTRDNSTESGKTERRKTEQDTKHQAKGMKIETIKIKDEKKESTCHSTLTTVQMIFALPSQLTQQKKKGNGCAHTHKHTLTKEKREEIWRV